VVAHARASPSTSSTPTTPTNVKPRTRTAPANHFRLGSNGNDIRP
jgi:hypothetical protein